MKRRRRRVGDATVAGALGRARLFVALVIIVISLRELQSELSTDGLATLLAGLGVAALVPLERRVRGWIGAPRLSAAIVVADTVIVLAVLWVHGTQPGEPASMLLILPMLEAAFRHGVFGVVMSWLAVSGAVGGQVALTWNGSPTQIERPIEFIAALVMIALPAGFVTEHMVDRVDRYSDAFDVAELRADTLAVLTDAMHQIVAAQRTDLHAALIDGAQRLVGGLARVGSRPPDQGDVPEDRRIIYMDIGGGAMLTCETSGDPHPFELEALDQLVAAARQLRRPSSTLRIEQSMVPSTVAGALPVLGAATPQPPTPSADVPAHGTPVPVIGLDAPAAAVAEPTPAAGLLDSPVEDGASALVEHSDDVVADHAAATDTPPTDDAAAQVTPRSRRLGGTLDRPGFIAEVGRRLRDEHGRVAVVFVSLDNHKLMHDLHGSDVGDMLLAETAYRLGDIDGAVGWLGDDEFAVVSRVGPHAGANGLLRQVRQALDGPIEIGDAGFTMLTCGIGVALEDLDAPATAEQLLRQATAEMYADKREQNRRFLAGAELELSELGDLTRIIES